MFTLYFHVPETHLDVVKNAIFEAGAGKVGHYCCCAWQILGEGQFMPLNGSNALIGEIGALTTIREYKVETVCDAAHIKGVIAALKLAHPYEVPSYQVVLLEDF